jgi:hypothetical protein
MKTTLDIPDALMDEARRVARERGITLRSLVEVALRQAIDSPPSGGEPFRLRKRPFGGQGLHPELVDADWSEIRRRAYEEAGG